MKRSSLLLPLALIANLLPVVANAQAAPAKLPVHTYRLTFTLIVMDAGKRTGVQHFSMTTISNSAHSTLKLGEKVPVATGSYQASTGVQTQMTYLDVGINLDAAVTEDTNGLQLYSKVEQSSVAPAPASSPSDPIVRQTVLSNTTTIPSTGKPLTIGSFDLPDTTRHMEIEVTVEPAA